ncbi:MAG TPA: hypothetical protein VJ508_15350, partial [Saprospiraceae bacterium]|nr:hypothetical protein [Saprospiraceae bacterium]
YSDAETVLDPDCTLSLTASYYYIDDVSLEQIAPPDPIEVELGGSVSSCVQYVIDPGIPNVQYTWDDGSHADTLLVTESGFHYVSVTDGCATGYGTVDVTITGLDDPVEIGVDEVTICEGETYTISLDPGAGTYTWSNGFSGSVIGITEPGLYVVTMSDEGCDFSTDQIQVMVIAPPAPFTLGPDTTICPGGEIDYAFDPVQGDFLWSNGSTSPEFTISNAGNYSLDISNACFDVEDEIVVSILEPPDLGLSTVPVPLCEGDILIIDLDPSLGHYLWQDGSTEYHYIITDPGDYTVSVTNVCDTYEGYLSVVGSQDPNPDLGPDTTLCASQLPYLLDVSLADGESYLWQDGSQADHFLVNTEGNYRVTVTNGCGEVTDEVQVSVLSSILSVILPPDQLLCPGDSFIITASADPGQYLWQDQSTADTLVAHSAGVYVLTVNNSCATGMDSMAIQYLPVLGLPDLGPDLALCPGEQLILTTGISGGSYLWQDGSTSDNFLVTNPGTYS